MINIGLNETEIKSVCEVFKNNSKISRAVVFGSRAKGNYKPYSDIDIALWGNLDVPDIEYVSCLLDELPTVYKFDIAAYEKIKNKMLRDHIDRVGVTIYNKK